MPKYVYFGIYIYIIFTTGTLNVFFFTVHISAEHEYFRWWEASNLNEKTIKSVKRKWMKIMRNGEGTSIMISQCSLKSFLMVRGRWMIRSSEKFM